MAKYPLIFTTWRDAIDSVTDNFSFNNHGPKAVIKAVDDWYGVSEPDSESDLATLLSYADSKLEPEKWNGFFRDNNFDILDEGGRI